MGDMTYDLDYAFDSSDYLNISDQKSYCNEKYIPLAKGIVDWYNRNKSLSPKQQRALEIFWVETTALINCN